MSFSFSLPFSRGGATPRLSCRRRSQGQARFTSTTVKAGRSSSSLRGQQGQGRASPCAGGATMKLANVVTGTGAELPSPVCLGPGRSLPHPHGGQGTRNATTPSRSVRHHCASGATAAHDLPAGEREGRAPVTPSELGLLRPFKNEGHRVMEF